MSLNEDDDRIDDPSDPGEATELGDRTEPLTGGATTANPSDRKICTWREATPQRWHNPVVTRSRTQQRNTPPGNP